MTTEVADCGVENCQEPIHSEPCHYKKCPDRTNWHRDHSTCEFYFGPKE